MQKFYFLLIFLLCPFLTADVKVHNIFGDNMILQQKTGNAIWGVAEPGEKVSVKASWGSEVATTADSNGKWKVILKTPAYGTGFSISIKGKNSIDIKNVAIGEVWLCAGQSTYKN
ncbi:MAG: sialate O-acetylesterase, partial [Lentisphaerales bacterium]|nr:sialate O-acetylesterase [Lentisphaerales bacterium]